MKSIKLGVCALAAMSLIACSSPQESETETEGSESGLAIPEAVMNSFNNTFEDATDAEWWPDGEEYEVSFMKDEQEYEAVFDANGELIEVEVEIEMDQLPMLAQDYINENYPDVEEFDVQKEMNSDGNFYEVEFEMNGAEIELFFDVNGEFLEIEIEEEVEEEIEVEEEVEVEMEDAKSA